MKFLCVALIFLVGLISCGGSEPESGQAETVFDPMVETLDKAKAVQDLELERKRNIDEQLD